MFKLKLFEIRGGKIRILPESKNVKGFLLGSLIIFIISLFSGWLRIDEKDLWKFYNAMLQQFGQSFRPESEKELEGRIELEVDKAIQSAEPEYNRIIEEADRIYKPRYVEEKNDENVCYTDDCKLLAPPMRICAPWVDTCPKD